MVDHNYDSVLVRYFLASSSLFECMHLTASSKTRKEVCAYEKCALIRKVRLTTRVSFKVIILTQKSLNGLNYIQLGLYGESRTVCSLAVLVTDIFSYCFDYQDS